MENVVITRWKKYGNDFGYAARADGTKLGSINLRTGAISVEEGADEAVIDAELRAWAAGLGATAAPVVEIAAATVLETAPAPAPAQPEPVAPALPPSAPEPHWTDLAAHRPGELVRAEAAAEWQASKDRSKLLAYGARVFNVHTQERAWRVGADGEEAVGARLEKLTGRGWHILHSIPVGTRGSDIDHVAIGPGGVFTLNTKNHPGGKIWVAKYQMRVNGTVVPYLRNANHEATRASKLLTTAVGFPVSVRSCVVVLTGTIVPEVKIKQMPDDVMVLDRMDVPGWFKRRPAVLKPDEVEAIYAVARRSDTWV